MKNNKLSMESPKEPWRSPPLEYRIHSQSPCDTPEQKILLQAFAIPMLGKTQCYTDAQLREVFQHYKQIELYNLLKKYPKSTYLNSLKPFQPSKHNYCLVDIVSIFAILRLSKPRDISVLSNQEIFLTLLFYLKEEQILDDLFMAYFSPRFQSGKFMNMMIRGCNGQKEQLTLLVVELMKSVLREIGMKASMQFQREKDILFELYPFYMSQRGVMLRRYSKPVAQTKIFVRDSIHKVQQSIRSQQSKREKPKLAKQLSTICQQPSKRQDSRASSCEYQMMEVESQSGFQSMFEEQIPHSPEVPDWCSEPDPCQGAITSAMMIAEIRREILEERMRQQEARKAEYMRTPRTQRICKRKVPGKTKFKILSTHRSLTN